VKENGSSSSIWCPRFVNSSRTDSGNRVFHLHIAAFKRSFRKSWLLERCLHVHSVIDHVRDKLRVRLSLVPPSHDAEPDVNVVLLHKGRNNRVQRTLVSGQRIRQPRRQLESRTPVVKRKTEYGSDHPGAIACVVTLNQRNQLDPLSLIIAADNGAILYFSRNYGAAIEKWHSVLDMDPGFMRAHLIQGAYVEKGKSRL